jgi:hypothetical protein
MIEVADVFRRFAADYLSAHGTSMLPSHRRHRRHPQLPHRRARRPGVNRLRMVTPLVFNYLIDSVWVSAFGSIRHRLPTMSPPGSSHPADFMQNSGL